MQYEILNKKISPIFKENFETYIFAPTNNYVKYFAVTLQSLIANSNPEKFYDIIILNSDINDRNSKLLNKMLPKNFNLRILDFKDYIKLENIDTDIQQSRWHFSTYYRLFAPLIMSEYNRIMYLDCDICITKNLSEAFETDIKNNCLIAIADSVIPVLDYFPNREFDIKEKLKLKNYKNYFNGGVIQFELRNIDFNYYENMLKEFFQSKMYPCADQDILNIIFENKTQLLPIKWNLQNDIFTYHEKLIDKFIEYYKEDFQDAITNPCIIHYVGGFKPWEHPEHPNSEIFWEYARQTPFYEEILYTNISKIVINKAIEPIINKIKIIEDKLNKNKILIGHIRNCILSKITRGKIQKQYQKKKEVSTMRIKNM